MIVRALILVLGGAAVACTSTQLTNAELAPPCAPSDVQCGQAALAPLAIGATTTLDVVLPTPAGGQLPVTHLRAANEGVAQLDEQGRIAGTGEGVTALLVLAADDSVLDFTHIAVATPQRLELHRPGDGRPLESPVYLAPGESLIVNLEVHSDSQLLSGDPDESWDIDDVAWNLRPDQQSAQIVAPDFIAGSATLFVTALGLEHAIQLEVRP